MRKIRQKQGHEEHRLAELVRALARQAAERDYEARNSKNSAAKDHATSPKAKQ